MPAVFAFADKVIGNIQTATFAAFGSFAMLEAHLSRHATEASRPPA
jgi:hypothetical protein